MKKFVVLNDENIVLFIGTFEDCFNYSNRNYKGTINTIKEYIK